jgi:hypothetical protein
MRRYARLATVSFVSLLLVTGCGASQRNHDQLICQKFASAMSVVNSSGINSTNLFSKALKLGGEAAHRPGYLSPRLARNLRVVTSEKCNIGRAALEFEADCRAAGIKGAVWLQYAGSCG